jgi:multidrug efflux pump subunit AcrB
MEAAAMDRLIEKGGATPQLAQAIGEALDIILKAANLVTVPMLDARFAQHEAKMEVRFGAIEARFSALERALERTKVWAVLLYAGLLMAFFGALAVDHRWLLDRQDQFSVQLQTRSDARFAAEEARTDRLLAEDNARTDKRIADDRAETDKRIADDRAETDKRIAEDRARIDAKFDQLRSLLNNRLRNP